MLNQSLSYKLVIKPLRSHLAFSTINKIGTKLVSKNLILVSSFVDADNTQLLNIYEGNKSSISSPHAYLSNKIYLGLKVSKKCSRSAVIRNKIKRRIRAAIREIISKWMSSHKKTNNDCTSTILNSQHHPYYQICDNSDSSYGTHNSYADIVASNSLISRAYLIIPHHCFINIKYSDLVIELSKLLYKLIRTHHDTTNNTARILWKNK